MPHPFRQVDVFTEEPLRGNPVAVVHDADDLSDEQMQRLASWTNLSETTFVLTPTEAGADYRVRIFTPVLELPFAGHPTLGTCHAWREAGGRPQRAGKVVQQCAAGLIDLQEGPDGTLAFAAPPLVRSGPVEPGLVTQVAVACGLDPAAVVAAEWVDNGPGWLGLLVDDVETLLAVRPAFIDEDVGLVALHPSGAPQAVEVRAFFPKDGAMVEDPVTGSLQASLAQWLLASGRLRAPYVASQGSALGRAGRVHVTQDPDGTIWIGGGTTTLVTGQLDL
jgi:PhzF family phenazine biosynthesis protein